MVVRLGDEPFLGGRLAWGEAVMLAEGVEVGRNLEREGGCWARRAPSFLTLLPVLEAERTEAA